MEKQIEKAKTLIARKEAGRRAKFVKKENATYLWKFIEIRTGVSLRRVGDLLWQVQAVRLRDPISGQERVTLTPVPAELKQILDTLGENTH